MRWSLGRNAFWLWLKGGLIVYFHVRSCSLSNDAVKSRTCFPKNMYDFLQKHVRVFQNYYYQDGTRTAYTRVGNIDIEGYAHDMGFTSYPSGCQQTFL